MSLTTALRRLLRPGSDPRETEKTLNLINEAKRLARRAEEGLPIDRADLERLGRNMTPTRPEAPFDLWGRPWGEPR